MRPLKGIQSVIPRARKEAIDKLISDAVRTGKSANRKQAYEVLDELVANISSTPLKSITKIRKAMVGDVISSDDWNKTQQEIFVDLNSVYRQINGVGALTEQQAEVNSGEFKKSRAAIAKALSELDAYQFLRENPEYQDVKFLNFDDTRNLAEQFPKANVDEKARSLELSPTAKKFLQAGNLELGGSNITINRLGGGLLAGLHDQFPVDNVVDADPATFWADMVLTDNRVRQSYVTSDGEQLLVEGLIAEVDIELNQVGRINTFRMLPFGPFPLKIVDLLYKETPQADGWLRVPDFESVRPTLDWYELSFKPITVSAIRVVVFQENYVNQVFHLPEKLVNDQSLWSQILRERADTTLETAALGDLTDEETGRVQAEPEQLAYINAINDVSSELKKYNYMVSEGSDEYKVSVNLIKAAGSVLNRLAKGAGDDLITTLGGETNDTNRLVEIKKDEFVYGIREVELSMSLYQHNGLWASPKFNSNSTILKVSIDTDEAHPTYSDEYGNFKRTSIEYSLNMGEGVRRPILPETAPVVSTAGGTRYLVEEEYIEIPRFSQLGYTRFEVDNLLATVRRNGQRLFSSEYSFSIDSTTGRGVLQILSNYHANSIYTITYTAAESGNIIDVDSIFTSTRLDTPEVFDKTSSSNAIRLQYFPYINYDIINNTDGWLREDDLDATYKYVPTLPLYSIGTVSVTNGSAAVVGTDTLWSSGLDAAEDNYIMIDGTSYEIASIDSDTGITLSANFTGSTDSAATYAISQLVELDGQTFSFNEMFYEPVEIYVNDVKASNVTDYYGHEHPAFIPQGRFGKGRQYIHVGQNIYFNEPINDATIEVTYAWLTQYVQLEAEMRCNIPVQTIVTPKLNNATIKIKNSVL